MLILSPDLRAKTDARPKAAPTLAAPQPQSLAEICQLVQNCAGLNGVELSATDLGEAMVKSVTGERIGLEHVHAALRQLGVPVRLESHAHLPKAGYPTLFESRTKGWILVTAREAETFRLWAPLAKGHEVEITHDALGAEYTGRVLTIAPTVAHLSARHINRPHKAHWFWGEWRQFRRPLGEVTLASLIANLLAVAVSLFSMQVYDRVIPYQSEPTLWVLGIGVMLAILLETGLKIARATLMEATGRRVELSVQHRLMARLLGMKMGPNARKPSEIFSAMRDFGSIREFFTSATVGTIADLPFVLIFLALIASIGGPIVWLVVLGGMLMVLPGLVLRRAFLRMASEAQGASVAQARLLYETVFEHEIITSERGGARYARQWSELVTLNASKNSHQRHLTLLVGSWTAACQQLAYIGVVIAGTYLAFTGAFTTGTIIAVGILTTRSLQPLAGLSNTIARWSQVKTALKALDTLAEAAQVEEPSRRYLRRDDLGGRFDIKNLQFAYDETAALACDLAELTIPQGQRLAILGANGSGKSTLMRLLAGLYEPSHGRVMIDGLDMAQIHPRDLRRNIGYLGQDVRLVAGTLRDNLNLSQLERDDARLLQALDFAGLGPFIRQHPLGLDLPVREGGQGLSVGQRQSLGWARIWLQNPSIVILDEPTAALDQTLEAQLIARLQSWLPGRTTIIATHRLAILQLIERMLILQNGRLAVDGPREGVLAHLSRANGAPLHVTPVPPRPHSPDPKGATA